MEKLENEAEENLSGIVSLKDTMLLKKEDISSHISYGNAHIQENEEVTTKYALKQVQVAQEIFSDGSSHQDANAQDLLALRSSSSDNQKVLVDQIQKIITTTETFKETVQKEFSKIITEQQTAFENVQKSNNELTADIKHKLSAEKKRVDCQETTSTSYIKEILQKTIHESEKVMIEKMLQCEDQIRIFKRDDLVKYESSGATPARKEYMISRDLAATSPHDRIIRRLKMEPGNNSSIDLDASCVILEVIYLFFCILFMLLTFL